ncbi:T9SS type A sorting domain-containing protein [Cytophaga aurantiaca]|uniref:T9SS type A sorting domain-containing protein n=1 Tax=Cytophaga aurantiaca TaxID=29530 RepID=UPI00036AF335|nr:T9SS type A sorting domain-containing protein [Cytophaga aurantiaca]
MNRRILKKATLFLIVCFLFLTSAQNLRACTGIDVIVTKITFTSITTDSYMYTYEIKNTGTQSVPLNQLSLQNYVATDAQGSNQKAAGGSNIVLSSNTGVIAAGATFTGTLGAYPNAVGTYPQSSYPYLFVTVSVYPGTECDNTNNTLVALIEMTTTGNQSKHTADATLIWNATTKSFLVKDWSGSSTSLQYNIFNMSGTLCMSGFIEEELSTTLTSLQNGMYIIYITDGEKVYSKKIIY